MTVRVLATGGTIASRIDPDSGAVVPADSAEALVASVPGLADHGPVSTEQLAQVNGWNMTPATMRTVAERARAAMIDDGVDGVVVTHGTDTVEETCYLVDLLAGPATRHGGIAFACAMRSAGETGADGPRNLLDAVRVATHPAARERGALLVANDEIHCARWVTKTDTVNIATFRSPPAGPVGHVVDGRPRFALPTPPRPPAAGGLEERVALVKPATGSDDALLRWLVDEREVAGLVLEGTGAGNVPGAVMPGVDHALERGVAVVIASRCWTGRTRPVYGGPGGGATLTDRGVIQAGSLNAPKARLGLMVALGRSRDPDDVREWFADA